MLVCLDLKYQFRSHTDSWKYHRDRQPMHVHSVNASRFYLLYLYLKIYYHSPTHLLLLSSFVSFIHHIYLNLHTFYFITIAIIYTFKVLLFHITISSVSILQKNIFIHTYIGSHNVIKANHVTFNQHIPKNNMINK